MGFLCRTPTLHLEVSLRITRVHLLLQTQIRPWVMGYPYRSGLGHLFSAHALFTAWLPGTSLLAVAFTTFWFLGCVARTPALSPLPLRMLYCSARPSGVLLSGLKFETIAKKKENICRRSAARGSRWTPPLVGIWLLHAFSEYRKQRNGCQNSFVSLSTPPCFRNRWLICCQLMQRIATPCSVHHGFEGSFCVL